MPHLSEQSQRPPPFILLVEDNPDDERMALLGLKHAHDNHNVQVARDGEQAINQIDDSAPEDIALVLLDLKLPKYDGLQVLEHIHAAYNGQCPPVVVFSSSDEPIDISRTNDLGADSYVTKPVGFDDYLATVQGIANQWLR